MGYESRLIVVDRWETKSFDGKRVLTVWGDKIAQFDMGYVAWNPNVVFTKPVDFPIGFDKWEEPTYTDKYGKHCGMADIHTVINVVEALEKSDHYRRFKPLLGFLKSLDESEWDDLRVVHFGY